MKRIYSELVEPILFSIVCISFITACFAKADVSDNNAKLIKAAQDGNVQAVKIALAEGADPNTKDDNGVPVLIWAANNGHTEVIKFLLEKGADINLKHPMTGLTALYVASGKGYANIVKLLLERNADVNVKSTIDGTTALYVAS